MCVWAIYYIYIYDIDKSQAHEFHLHLWKAASLGFHRAGRRQSGQEGQEDVETERAEQPMGRS